MSGRENSSWRGLIGRVQVYCYAAFRLPRISEAAERTSQESCGHISRGHL
jgi:hypothetical protein